VDTLTREQPELGPSFLGVPTADATSPNTITPKAEAHTYYVSLTGSDTNPGTQDQPFHSISKGILALQAGDALLVHGGVYNEAVSISASGTESAPITIAAYLNESPMIDGMGKLPAHQSDSLVLLKGSYIVFRGFEVRNSNAYNSTGVILEGPHNTVSHLNVHHHYGAGIFAEGDYSIVEYSTVWENAYRNCRASDCPVSPYPNGGWATGISAARDPVDQITDHAILRHNIVYNNWGEGLSTFEARGTVMEDNIVYDNWATNTYISDASDVLFQRNLIYVTENNVVGRKKACLTMAEERADKPRSFSNKVVNNMCLNSDFSIFTWTLVPNTGLVYATIANNTIVNGTLKSGKLNTGSVFINNIVINGDSKTLVPSADGLRFSNNLWSEAPPKTALGQNSIVANPRVLMIGNMAAGKLTSDYFKLSPKSPAKVAGLQTIDTPGDDAFGHKRASPPTIGAFEITQ
jgi:hypothetical protein